VEETPVIGYVRIAPREERRSRPGLDAQQAAVERECERRGWRLLSVEQDVRSGRTLQRPGLTSALEACRSGRAAAIVVARLDRLTYSVEHLARLVADAREGGFNLVAPDVGLDLASAEGRQLADVLAAAASWRPRPIALRGLQARPASSAGRRGRGRPVSTPPALAARIRSLRAGGWTLQAICDALNAEGEPTPRGGLHWRPSSLRAILRNPKEER
jgi:DNA invertase Pin-like site-specific DNA recombinase